MNRFFSSQWLENDFLSFLDEWESEGYLVPNVTAFDRQKLCFL